MSGQYEIEQRLSIAETYPESLRKECNSSSNETLEDLKKQPETHKDNVK